MCIYRKCIGGCLGMNGKLIDDGTLISGMEAVTDQEIADNSVYSKGNLSRLINVFKKAYRGESVTISYLGGSITNGSSADPKETNCFAYRTTQWWKKTFPNAKINYVNAGIGATDSYLGVHRVAQDVLFKNPDLVVVEFSVNDYRSHNQESYESLLRRILKYKTKPAVVALCLTQFSQEGQCINYSQYHKIIADHYNVSVISYGDVVGPRLENGTLQWNQLGPSNDFTHPNNAGHKIISRCLNCFYQKVLEEMKSQSDGDFGIYEMPEDTLTESRYENGEILDHRSGSKAGISISGSNVSRVTVENAQFPYGWQTDTGADITVTIENATNIGLIYYGGMEKSYGIFDVYVDDRYIDTIDTYFYGSWGSHADYKLLLTNGTTGQHTVRIMKNEYSQGNKFIILGFTVSRSCYE
ncbi:MAG: SGNH/GDSL hydrolase family protein [Paenibacillaceae bacterium]|nr:SGNH/GDSL hydrolase family protein [Paenibacillaceae bacterium]